MSKQTLVLIGLFVFGAVCSLTTTRGAQSAAQQDALNKREALYRRNNLGVAWLEQFKHEEAVKEFQQALAADPQFAVARINLALAYTFLNDSPKALAEAKKAVEVAPNHPSAQYALGLALRAEKQYDEALAAFGKVLALDPQDPAANIQTGQLFAQKQQYDAAIKAFQLALNSEPYNQTAAYNLAQAYLRSGKQADGQKYLAVFQKLRASGYATSLGNVYGEKGKYAEGVITAGAEPELVSKESAVKFVDATAALGLNVKTTVKPLSGVLGRKLNKAEFNDALKRELVAPFSVNVDLGDYDGDHKLDVLVAGLEGEKPFIKLLHNEGGKFAEVTAAAKLTTTKPVSGGVFGDFDNDNKTDLIVFGYQTLALWRNNGDGTFADVTAKVGLPANYADWALTAAWVDADHDGDLDLFVGNFADLSAWPNAADSSVFPDDFAGAENKFFRNNGNGTFTDDTAKAGLGGGKLKTTAVVCTDYDNQRDVDFFVVNYDGPSQLLANQRDGTFKLVSSEAVIPDRQPALSVGAGDLNKDGYTDFYLPGRGEAHWKISDGHRAFRQASSFDAGTAGILFEAYAARIADLDNDGILDVVELDKDWLRVRHYRPSSDGRSVWVAGASERVGSDTRAFALGDLAGDGMLDFITVKNDGTLIAFKTEGASNNLVRLNLTGRTSNRSAIGTKAELRSGSLRQKLEVYASSPAPAATGLMFGLGFRTQVDALQLIWPAGIVQSELAIKPGDNTFEELDRKGTSCPLLYAWNGSEYSFVTDFLGGSALGFLEEPGVWNYPDTDEYVRVTGEQLRARDGVYSLRMNNQLEEVIYFDAVKLLAVDHPANVDVYPNERLMPTPPYPTFKVYSTRNPQPPLSAVDEAGRDVLPLLTQVDRRYPEAFDKLPFKGYAREHTLTLDLGARAKDARRVLLLLTAWIDYADSTANRAAAQAGVKLIPPYLQVKNARGEWETAIAQMGFPAGLPKTMTVELPKDALCHSTQVRIVTSMRIYWDQILTAVNNEVVSNDQSNLRVTTLQPQQAELRWRGFPREYTPDGRLPKLYDYRVIEPVAPWKAHLGNYTRLGDVRPLVLAVDDQYVITRNGDELQVDFDARKLPALPAGWKRDFLVYADGFGKDMDINSARPDTIGELPYHRMKAYPYAPGDAYPNDAAHQAYLRQYNTRTVRDQQAARWQAVR
ncbi:MAG: VCBS repeat-containing protein [Acidobacteria bacterium]|nr:VCBS repeat-containing protein [Acidobacteriota bacterium]MBI3423507.1 VCBS repeat-containing protein [Acidobacteriota bacterium]